jgi:cobalt/nickel transport protein
MKRTNLILLVVVLVLVSLPLLLPVPGGLQEPFAGADAQAKDAIIAANPDYQPWFKPLWEPPRSTKVSCAVAVVSGMEVNVTVALSNETTQLLAPKPLT